MNTKLTYTLAVSLVAMVASCGQPAATDETAAAGAPVENATPPADDRLKTFLYDTEGTYGWQTTADNISLDFIPDGRLHIQGPDGEATLWEGTWSLQGDQLTMDRKDLGKTETVTAKQDGEKLVLGERVYTRYRAE